MGFEVRAFRSETRTDLASGNQLTMLTVLYEIAPRVVLGVAFTEKLCVEDPFADVQFIGCTDGRTVVQVTHTWNDMPLRYTYQEAELLFEELESAYAQKLLRELDEHFPLRSKVGPALA